MLLNLTLETALERLEEPRTLFDETLVPSQSEEASHSPYLPGYDWLFLFERKLGRLLDPWLQPHRLQLIGSGGILSEALSNAYCHAHGRDATLPIRTQILVAQHGLVVRIKDSGSGFAVHEIVRKYHAGDSYYHVAGNGIRRMIESSIFGVFFTDQGSAFHMLYLFDGSLSQWAADGQALQPGYA